MKRCAAHPTPTPCATLRVEASGGAAVGVESVGRKKKVPLASGTHPSQAEAEAEAEAQAEAAGTESPRTRVVELVHANPSVTALIAMGFSTRPLPTFLPEITKLYTLHRSILLGRPVM